MNFINYLSSCAIPIIFLLILTFSLKEKQKVYDDFVDGAKDGITTTIKILPTLVGLFVAIGALRSSGILDLFIELISPVTSLFNIPKEIMPLALLRPLSGSGAIAVATDIFKSYGIDSNIGLIASTIMGSTETTFYTIAVYTSCVGIKNIRFVIIPALVADFVGMITSVIIWQILS